MGISNTVLPQGWDFDGSRGILSGSMGRVNKMLKSNKSNRRLMCYVILGVVVLVLLGYTLASRATQPRPLDEGAHVRFFIQRPYQDLLALHSRTE
ncbi:hypothetical protein HPB51_007912 [Rhipicephalus microplus]|uniref:Uncharacterized protein n=1 Tax=Rhipicephalus microplus TaxID=6941 RepID=A0A9J6END7_RHIMP|nr:hypothetical protein HPB51_007912 [Rhipicephalus microplus]